MKNALILLLLSSTFAVAQTHTDSLQLNYSEETVTEFKKTTLIDEYEKAFGGHRLVKSGLRLAGGQLENQNSFAQLQFEKK